MANSGFPLWCSFSCQLCLFKFGFSSIMNDIHVSWQGSEKPAPSDLTAVLSVRRRVVESTRRRSIYRSQGVDYTLSTRRPRHEAPSSRSYQRDFGISSSSSGAAAPYFLDETDLLADRIAAF